MQSAEIVSRNEIAVGGVESADGVVGRVGEQNAVGAVAQIDGARAVQADVTAFDEVEPSIRDLNAVTGKSVDHQRTNHAVARGNLQSIGRNTRVDAVEFHDRRADESGL